ncbi:MAG: transposase [Pseudobdellovibrionaceae bacterium]|nr:transposase [Pseudobdellovibrionaceae bacterium]
MSKTQIITGVERRRKFTDKEKAALVLETMESSLAAVGRKHGIAPSALYRWKQKFPPKSFAMVEVKDNPPKSSNPPKPPRQGHAGLWEVSNGKDYNWWL